MQQASPAMIDPNGEVDRAMVRRMVEDFWRSLLLHGLHLGATRPAMSREEAAGLALDSSRQFSERNEATAALMPPDKGNAFLQMIEEEDAICFEELQRNPEGFHHRLGINLNSNQQPRQPVGNRRQGIGEMAVRTAVRATIWEVIWSLFRR
jgi:hypothetical protein